jgi:hypothetical protein
VTFNNPTLNLASVEAALGGSGNVGNNAENQDYLLCAGDHGAGHTNQDHMAERFCAYHGYTSFSDVQVVSQGGSCAVYHESGNGRRVDTSHGSKISSISCGNNLGQGVFNNPTINLAEAEAALGGSGNVGNNADSTSPYLLCAGDHGAGHTNQDHMAQRFCELEGYTGVDSIQSVSQGGSCAVYHNQGSGRRVDGGHGTKISKIVCTKPAPYVAPVLTCQEDGTWEADRSCQCAAVDQTFNDPTVNLFALEQALGGSGNVGNNADSTSPYLLCAGDHGAGHTNQAHMADRFCLYHGYPGGHSSIQSVSQGGSCAVYHNQGSGRRVDGGHGTKISQIVCVGQC